MCPATNTLEIFKHSTWRSFENFAQYSREKEKGVKGEWRLRGRCSQGKGICFFIVGACQKPCEADGIPAEVCKRSLARWAAARKGLKPGMGWWFPGWGREQNQQPQAMSRLSSRRTQNTAWQAEGQRRAVWHLRSELATRYWGTSQGDNWKGQAVSLKLLINSKQEPQQCRRHRHTCKGVFSLI